jgi:hypothetical protein
LAWRQPSQTKELKQQNESAELLSKRIIWDKDESAE